MLIARLSKEHPGKVRVVDEDKLPELRKSANWRRVGAYPLGSPDFIRPCKNHLRSGRRLTIVQLGQGIHVFARARKRSSAEPAPEMATAGAAESPQARAPAPRRRRNTSRPMLRAGGLEARPAVGSAPFTSFLKDVPDQPVEDPMRPPLGEVARELRAHENELLTMPVHTPWALRGWSFREARLQDGELRASYYLYDSAEANRRGQAVGQLHLRAQKGEPELASAWIEEVSLVFDRRPRKTNKAVAEILELGAADGDDEEEIPTMNGGGFALQVLFDEAETAVDRPEEADTVIPTKAPRRAAAPTSDKAARTPPPPPSAAKPQLSRRTLVGFLAVVALFVFKVSTGEDDEDLGGADPTAARPPKLADPYEEEPLDDLPEGVKAKVRRLGNPTLLGPLPLKKVNPIVDATLLRQRHCYHAYLLDGGGTAGNVQVKLVIDELGKLAQVDVGRSDIDDSGFKGCIEQSFDGLRFMTPSQSSVTVASYTFAFGLGLQPTDDAP